MGIFNPITGSGGSANTNYKGWYATQLALTTAYPVGQNGWYAIVGSTDTVWTWDSDATAWKNTNVGSLVTSVNTQIGDVVLNQDHVLDGITYKQYSNTEKTKLAGIANNATANSTDSFLLDRVNHTGTQLSSTISDFQSTVSTNSDVMSAYAHISTTNNPHSVTKTQVGLSNVDNTSDINKPISTATQNALDLKQNLVSTPTLNDILLTNSLGQSIDSGKQFSNDTNLSSASSNKIPTELAVKTYVDNAQLSSPLNSVKFLSDTNFSATYDNGTAGIGATLTATTTGVINIDNNNIVVNNEVIFNGQSNDFENGVYVCTTEGDLLTQAIFTRRSDFDQSVETISSRLIIVEEGQQYVNTVWISQSNTVTIGVDPISFSNISFQPTNLSTSNNTANSLDINSSTGTDITLNSATTSVAGLLNATDKQKIDNTSNTNTGDETQTTIKTKLGTASTSQDGYLTSTDWNTFNNKLTANTAITGATYTKITYDSKGLITSGANALASDIINTPAGTIIATDVQTAINELDTEKEPVFSKNTAFNKNFGTTADTVCEGNDPRLSSAGGINKVISSLTYTVLDTDGVIEVDTTLNIVTITIPNTLTASKVNIIHIAGINNMVLTSTKPMVDFNGTLQTTITTNNLHLSYTFYNGRDNFQLL
jgi:hypothetical protein